MCNNKYVPEFWSLLVHLEIDTTIAQNNVFAEGCSPVHLKSVETHETSANHVRATQMLPGQVYHQAYLPSWWLW